MRRSFGKKGPKDASTLGIGVLQNRSVIFGEEWQ